jgi:hypothetical protein
VGYCVLAHIVSHCRPTEFTPTRCCGTRSRSATATHEEWPDRGTEWRRRVAVLGGRSARFEVSSECADCSYGPLLPRPRAATARPAAHRGARPLAGGWIPTTLAPRRTATQETNEFEFHGSPVPNSSRPRRHPAPRHRAVRYAGLGPAPAQLRIDLLTHKSRAPNGRDHTGDEDKESRRLFKEFPADPDDVGSCTQRNPVEVDCRLVSDTGSESRTGSASSNHSSHILPARSALFHRRGPNRTPSSSPGPTPLYERCRLGPKCRCDC